MYSLKALVETLGMFLCMIAFSFENFPIVNQPLLHPHLTLKLKYPVVTGMILLIMAMHEGYTTVVV